MAPQRTIVDHLVRSEPAAPESRDLRKPFGAMRCTYSRKIGWRCGGLFTASVRSATINRNDLDTHELLPLILGMHGDELESEFLLRARRGSEQIAAGGHPLFQPRCSKPVITSHAARGRSDAAPSHPRYRSSLHRLLASLTRGR